ncbi:uncharacterized protein LOC141590210 [Silene latifolia]|uniref:uncharacterized protein LOC141590210 n=1 Tax=Silene latifolia TaxID=37657 RepID=UPI003D786C43
MEDMVVLDEKYAVGLQCFQVKIFFPIVHEKHFFVYVVDLVRKRFVILDNSLSDEDAIKKYGVSPLLTIDAFGRFLGENPKTSDSSNIVLAMDPIVAKLSWRNNYNVDDCGIYTMRHMETFMGLISWKCGLMKNDRSVLKVLRYKYLCTLLMFEHNDCHETVADHAKKGHFSKASDYI